MVAISQKTSRLKDFLQHSPHCMTGFCLPTIKLRSGTTTEYGWGRKEDEWQRVMTQLSPTPEAIIQLVKCNCAKERCSNNRCQCRKRAGFKCTDLCTCSEDEICYNVGDDLVKQFDDSSDEDDE